MASTNVPQITITPNGIVVPDESLILAGVQADLNVAFGGTLTFSTSDGSPTNPTPQGQLATSESAIIGDCYAVFAWYVSMVDPATSQGRIQDGIGRIYYMTRIAGAPTLQPVSCMGLPGVVIQPASLILDDSGVLWLASTGGTIGVSGTVVVNFQCSVDGPTPAPESFTIYQAITGWDAVSPSGDAVLGRLVETPQQFEQRRQLSVASNSNQILDSIQGTVLALPGVLDAYCYDNSSSSPVTVGGVTIAGNSIYICVLGGDENDVAFGIWSKKGPGCGYTGNTAVLITDPNPAYNPPAPTYTVTFEVPTVTAFALLVTLKNNIAIPASALTQIQAAIVNAFAGLDGGTRAKIGSTVFAARYYSDVLALGPWAQIISIKLGLLGGAWTGNASISGTTLTVNSTASGALAAGQLLQDTGILASGTKIVSGSGSSWVVSISQTVASEAMSATTLLDDVTVNINQAPSIAAVNVNMVAQ